MIPLSPAPPALASEQLALYYANEPLLEGLPVLIFYGPSTTVNSTHNTSRVQAHIYSLAGFRTFSRLTIAPTSPLYAAVTHLPSELQGDEVYRGLAAALLSYFAALPKSTKTVLRDLAGSHRVNHLAPMMFDEMHAGDLAARMVHFERKEDIAAYLTSALATRSLSWVDVDVILPSGSIVQATDRGCETNVLVDDNGLPLYDYGKYNALIESFGSPAFLPTSKLQRAPSKPTAHNKSSMLSKSQKVLLRREMCELVDTENSYLKKLRELVDIASTNFHQYTASENWRRLFPASLPQLQDINSSFYQEIHAILDTTESDAIRDIEGVNAHACGMPDDITYGQRRDPTGATSLAKAVLKWFPVFKEPYQSYLRASNQFPHVITQLLNETSPDLAQHLLDYGEQYLRSTVIEPVQRLPRYSLLIDNIVNLLPSSHPALAGFLKARDIITDICALDVTEIGNATQSSTILQCLVSDWPDRSLPRGRLIAAADINVLEPPYRIGSQCAAAILLVFPGKLVILRKMGQDHLSARGLLAEVDHPKMPLDNASSGPCHDKGLQFEKIYDLESLQLHESMDGHLIYASETPSASLVPHETLSMPTRVFQLRAPYHGKASRLTEEIAKARIEARYPEDIRESKKWTLRSIEASEHGVGIMGAFVEMDEYNSLHVQHSKSQIKVVIDGQANTQSMMDNNSETDVAARLTTSQTGGYALEFECSRGSHFIDDCRYEDVVPLFRKRLEEHLCHRDGVSSTCIAQQEISFNSNVLRVVPIHERQKESKHRYFRPRSPVKLLSNMLGGSANQPTTPQTFLTRATPIESIPPLLSPAEPREIANRGSNENESIAASKVALVESSSDAFKSPLALLEDTLAAYIVALRSRSGNVVGKILQARASADELSINELYNTLLEDPSRLESAAIVSVDVLFAAFEKFLRRAWRERIGPVLAPRVIKEMQFNVDTGKPAMFTQHFKHSLEEMSPQNRRAVAAIVKLLSDLLDASGNDGDRGVLIASFAEALILAGKPHDYIMLLDRLVDDYECLFDDVIVYDGSGGGTTSNICSLDRTRSFNTGSLSSNASSLRRKLGLGGTLSRENSKSESESRVASIWRTLSKNPRSSPGDFSQPASSSKASLVRSRSTDTDIRMLPPSRPISRDRPPTTGSAGSDVSHLRPGSSHLNTKGLSRIGEDTPTQVPPLPLKKKRRSSLSDLQPLRSPDLTTTIALLQPRKPDENYSPLTHPKSLPRTPSSSKQALSLQLESRSPQRSGIPRYGSPQNKQTSASKDQHTSVNSSPPIHHSSAKSMSVPKSKAVTITSYTPQIRKMSKSNIPAPRVGLSERTWPPNGSKPPPSKTPKTPQKMRVQSPQKLRQRLSQEQKTTNAAEGSLEAEMNKIDEELSGIKQLDSSQVSLLKSSQTDLNSLASRLTSLETKLKDLTTENTTRYASFRLDLDTSVVTSEKKARKLDELYKEANAENEALYDRFNEELGKILARVRKGDGVVEMRAKLGEAQSEVGRLKGENARLKREVAGLRSLLKGELDLEGGGIGQR